MNNRGFIGDVFSVLTTGIIVAVVVLIAVLLLKAFDDTLKGSTDPAVLEASSVSDIGTSRMPRAYDIMLVLMLIGLPLISAILSYNLEVTGAAFPVMIILTFLYVIVGAVIGNFWITLTADPMISTVSGTLTMSGYIFTHYALYTLYVVLCVVGGLFFRQRGPA